MTGLGRGTIAFYSLFMLLGGIMGASKSMISLIAGAGSALLLLGCYAVAKGRPKLGMGLAAFLALVFTGQMGMRFFKSGNFYPSGIVAVVSLIALIVLGLTWLQQPVDSDL